MGDLSARAKKQGPSARIGCDERLNGTSHSIYKLPGQSSKDCGGCSGRKTKGGCFTHSQISVKELLAECTRKNKYTEGFSCTLCVAFTVPDTGTIVADQNGRKVGKSSELQRVSLEGLLSTWKENFGLLKVPGRGG